MTDCFKVFPRVSSAANRFYRKNGERLLFVILAFVLTGSVRGQGTANHTIPLPSNWYIQSSEKISVSGDSISLPGFDVKNWYPATVPSTILGSLVKDSIYKDIFFGENLEKIPTEQFKKPWWYRTELVIPKAKGNRTVELVFDGINYRASVWFNGNLVATSDTTLGGFRRFKIDVSPFARLGERNAVAVEVFPPTPGSLTMGFVDWNPKSPDRNMGLWRTCELRLAGDVSINSPFVVTTLDTVTLKEAQLEISTEIQNNTGHAVSGVLIGKVGSITLDKSVVLGAHEKKLVKFTPENYKQLYIRNPRVWWTHDLGKPSLYDLKLEFRSKKLVSDSRELKFGIRTISEYFTPEGYRGYKLNGKKILIRGGGWTDHLLLDNSHENGAPRAIDYARQMNLNTIRMEGFWGESQDIYNLCDEKGILIMVGWSAQWEWQDVFGKEADEFGGIKSSEDMKLAAESWKDQVKWLRNHPSIFLWLYGSDKLPRPELEKEYLRILSKYDSTRPSLASAKGHTSQISGPTGVKMNGPYDYVPPSYWYVDKENGGAFGFNTETGPGPQVPPIESLRKMMPADSLWPISSDWYYHCSRGMFHNLTRYNEAMENRLGKPVSLNDYERKAQFLNYEGMRAMFEAFEANRYTATGIIQWMYNAAWPKLWWQLFDYYLMPNGAFYGARKACEPLHILYNYGTNAVDVVNNTLKVHKGLTASVRVLNFDMSEQFAQKKMFDIHSNRSEQLIAIPSLNDLSKTYFVELKLFSRDKKLANTNFYVLSTKLDVLDTTKTTWYVTPEKEYADLTELNALPNTYIQAKWNLTERPKREYFDIHVKNSSSHLAFQISLVVVKGKQEESILPIFLDDNYFSLLPGEERTIRGYFWKQDMDGKTPMLRVAGWNVPEYYVSPSK